MKKVAEVLRSLSASPQEIAERTRIPLERLQAILGGQSPTLAELRSLSRSLRLPMRVFGTGRTSEAPSDLGVLFRTSIPKERQHDASLEQISGFVEAALQLLPKRDGIPDWLKTFSAQEETYQEADRLASLFRHSFMPDQLNEPATGLPTLIENLGSVVISQLRHSRYEGASVIIGGYCFVFVSPRFAARMLFTLAHELGHLIAHRSNDPLAVFDQASQVGGLRRSTKAEMFVNAFASVLLLPDQGVARALQKFRQFYGVSSDSLGDVEILLLARYFGVSFDVAARRCEDLELLPTGGAVSLAQTLRKEFGSPEKRADSLGLPQRLPIALPKVSANLFAAALTQIEKGSVSTGWVADRLNLSVEELFAARRELALGIRD